MNDPSTSTVLGIDIGGTKTEACLYSIASDHTFQILGRKRIPTLNHKPYADYLDRLSKLVAEMISEFYSNTELQGIGIGIPGSVDPVRQIMMQGNLTLLKGRPLLSDFRKKLQSILTSDRIPDDLPMIGDNDANCFALAEVMFGAGQTYAKKHSLEARDLSAIGVTLGTGVGGGIIVDGKILRGRRGGAGEIGHLRLIPSGRSCYCGKFGCAEQYISGSALEWSYRERTRHPLPLPSPNGNEIFRLADQKDPIAVATVEAYRDDLVEFLSNLSNLFDPHLIILGGGVSLQPRIYTDIEDRLSKACFLTQDPPQVVQNQCGDAAGTLGAAWLATLRKDQK